MVGVLAVQSEDIEGHVLQRPDVLQNREREEKEESRKRGQNRKRDVNAAMEVLTSAATGAFGKMTLAVPAHLREMPETAIVVEAAIEAGGRTYTFVDNLGTGAGATQNEVKYTGVIATDLASLKEAINNGAAGTGSGSNYSTGTVVNANVTATTLASPVLTLAANANGTAGTVGGSIVENTGSGGSFATQVAGTAGSTVTLGSQTYTFVTSLGTGAGATTNEIVGATGGGALTTELTNLVDAINYTSPNTGKYSVANTVANTTASAVVNGNDLGATFTATTAGTGTSGAQTGNFVGVSGTAGTFTNGAGGATTDLAGGTAASVVTVGNQAYTFVNAAQLPTANPYSVLINTTASGTAAQILGSLQNLAYAVDGTGTAGTNPAVDNYSSAAANTYATAATPVAVGTGNTSTLAFTAQINGLGTSQAGTGNYTVSTTTGTTNGFAGTTFANGTTGDSITVGGQTYNFVSALSTNAGGTANEVVAGASVAQDLLNLQAAVNGTGGSGYSSNTPVNTSASVTGTTGTTATFTALSSGTGGNSISTAISGGIGSFATTDFTGGSSLQSVGGPAVAGDTVTVGGTQYTFVSAITDISPANSVLVGAGTGAASEAASLTNLAAAVNGATGEGVTYGLNTIANASATANATSTTPGGTINEVVFTALTGGIAGNSISSTSTGGDNIFSGALFTGGGTSTNDLLTSADATAALTLINNAVATVASLRGNIGATVNRLQAASSVITNQTQNLTSAENDVTAADIPSTVANLSQYSILEQTGVSALAQANQQQQLVLKLLQ